jgi:hypothetical protein
MAPQSLTMYVSIAEAGRGAHADAHFCSPKRTNLDQPSRGLDNLLSELQVVKQARVHGHRSIAAEIAALQTIQRQNFVGELPFLHLVERDTAILPSRRAGHCQSYPQMARDNDPTSMLRLGFVVRLLQIHAREVYLAHVCTALPSFEFPT